MNRAVPMVFMLVSLGGASCLSAAGSAVLNDVGFDQHLGAPLPLDLTFIDETAHEVKLGDYFREKPVILALVSYRCPSLCTLVMNGLLQGLRDMPLTAGRDFQVVTVSFDPRETPALAATKNRNYVGQYGRPGAAKAWHFLTGKPESIDKLVRAVGFRYVYDAVQGDYIHTSGLMVLTPTGKISRYFFGIQFPGRDLRQGLVEAANGKVGPASDQSLLYCFHYDPVLGLYSTSVLNSVRVGGAITIGLLIALVWYLRRHEPRLARLAVGDALLKGAPT